MYNMVECNRFTIAREFLMEHHWPMNLNDSRFDKCYCERCYSTECKNTFVVGGRIYVVPRNYTRFGIGVDKNYAAHLKLWTDWVNCFHGTSVKNAKSIIEHRMMLLPGEETMHGNRISIQPGHIQGEVFFFTTPTIKYASLPLYARKYEFQSPSDNQNYNITVVLQCKQKPDSFTVQCQTVGAGTRICPFIDNTELEWKTKQRASIIPYGLLLLVEPNRGQFDGIPKPKSSQLQVKCTHCNNLNDWINPESNQGIMMKCETTSCNIIFKPFTCPYCSQSWTICACFYRFNHEVVFECYNPNCRKELMTRKCPNCPDGFNFCKLPDVKQVVSVTCSNKICKNKSHLVGMCSHCAQLKNIKSMDVGNGGVIITCSECSRKCQLVQCPNCSQVNIYPNAFAKIGRDDIVTCAYQNCGERFVQPLRKKQRKNQQNFNV